jgi:RNA polymerase sigma-70 factor (ECF subfamily)
VQEVFLAVAGHIDDFSPSGPASSFRGWLWTISRNQIRLYYRKQRDRPRATGGSDAHRDLNEVPDLLQQVEEISVDQSRQSQVHRALESIRHDLEPQTWQALLRVTLGGHSAADVAAELAMTPAAVRQAKYRVLCRLHDEIGGC